MQRNDWTFTYPATQLAETARAKIDAHQKQLDFWMAKRNELIERIRAEGIEVNEKIALGLVNQKARDWDRGGEVMIRNDLRKGLTETFEKLAYHTERRDTYDGWEQVLKANPNASFALDIEDWLFFFGRDVSRNDD